ncbi:MAG: HAMP domain-containing histidine kinase [Bacteroidales bacterium]|nr:HAMP domain-containing histidine kinase [Bacteroidales bacterium]
MKKKKVVSWSIVMLSVSMIVLIMLQVSHITSSYKKSAEITERAINEAINQTIITLQKQEVAIFVYDKFKVQDGGKTDTRPDKVHINSTVTSYFDEENIPNNAIKISDKHSYSIKNEDVDAIEAYYLGQLSDPSSQFNKLAIQLEAEFTCRQLPIEKRFDAETIERVLRRTLTSFGIDMNFEFAIIDDISMETKLASKNFDISRLDKCYKYNMTPGNVMENPNLFVVDFPTKKNAIFASIYSQVIVSLLISILFIATFSVAIFTILKQKKLNAIKTDFVNNMTHEFKTPIATIKLAATAIKSPQVIENKETISGMAEVILQETSRMTQHVEQVLQIATLDRNGLKLNLTDEDANAFVRDVAGTMSLQVSQKGGSLQIETCDGEVHIQMDTVLMTTVLINLIDNAIKYTKDAPEIYVSTYTKGDRFFFAVKDNGIGMSKDAQTKVFDRFYRAHTGNTHNVKGFGLGLNYAKEIVLAHHGLITVNSTEGKGSTFTVSLPLTLKDINYE